MPDAVKEYVINKNVINLRRLQTQTFTYYKDDMAKCDVNNKLKISKVYDLLMSNMANKVKRVQYKKIENKEDSNLEKYEEKFDYLVATGID